LRSELPLTLSQAQSGRSVFGFSRPRVVAEWHVSWNSE
jgi:hypothetical protein